MLTVSGTYENGSINLDERIQFKRKMKVNTLKTEGRDENRQLDFLTTFKASLLIDDGKLG
jgi:hypothetical protein